VHRFSTSPCQRLRAYLSFVLLTCALSVAGFAQSLNPPEAPRPQLTPEETAEGWQLLFDGESTNGWKGVNRADFPYNGWAVENGYIRTLKPGPVGDIITKGEYRNFDLRFEWMVEPGGNSGVKYLVAEGRPEPNIPNVNRTKLPRLALLAAGLALGVYILFFRRSLSRHLAVRIVAVVVIATCGYLLITGSRAYFDQINALRHSAVGLEYQVLDNVNNAEPRSNPKASAASLYILIEANEKELRPQGEFNEGRILVQDEVVQHWLNGKKVLEYRINDPEVAAKVAATKYDIVPGFLSKDGGHIALQHHHDYAWFKNLKIRPLEANAAPVAQQ